MNTGCEYLWIILLRGKECITGWPCEADGDSVLFVVDHKIYRATARLARGLCPELRRRLLEEYDDALETDEQHQR